MNPSLWPRWVRILALVVASLLVAALLVVLFWPQPTPERGTLSDKQKAAYEQQVQNLMADTAAMNQRIRELQAASKQAAAERKAAAQKVNTVIIHHKAEHEAYTRLSPSARTAADISTIQQARPTTSKHRDTPIIED